MSNPCTNSDDSKQDAKSAAKSRSPNFHQEKTQKQPRKNKIHQNAASTGHKGRSYASLNTIDIKFTETKKEQSTKYNGRSTPKPITIIMAASSLQKKMTSKNVSSTQMPREGRKQNKRTSKEEKRTLHGSQNSQSAAFKPESHTTKRFNDILERLRFSE